MVSVPQERQCKCEDCYNRFQIYPGKRGRPKEFCSERCRQIHFTGALEEEVRKAQQSARKYQSSLQASLKKKFKGQETQIDRRAMLTGMTATFLGVFLEKKWPQGRSKTAKHEAAWQELREIRRLLWLNPDPNAAIARARATALQAVLTPLVSKDRTAARIWIYCEEIKRDAGVAGESDEAFKQIETQVELVEYYWNRDHDHLNFAYALLSHANLERNRLARVPKEFGDKHADRAKRRILDALNVLKGPCYKQDKVIVNMLHHQATLMLFRLEAFQYRAPRAAKQRLDELQQLDEQINGGIESPRTSIETLREEAGFCQGLKQDRDEANALLQKATALSKTLDVQPIPAQLSLLRPKLEILQRRKDSSFEEEVKNYLALLHKHPSAYNMNQIRSLYREAGYNLAEIGHDNPTIYTTPMMVYLYYEDFSLRREGLL
jgi:endogenous inhibitor of DNA gyrase (YacG/DUF329 family)